MTLLESVCPHCREKIAIDDSRGRLFCMYCGASFSPADLTEIHGRLVLQRDAHHADSSGEIDSEAITVTGAENVNARATVYADGKALCNIRKGETVVLDIEPGTYTMWARAGIEGSKKIEMELKQGERLQVVYHGFKGYDIVKVDR